MPLVLVWLAEIGKYDFSAFWIAARQALSGDAGAIYDALVAQRIADQFTYGIGAIYGKAVKGVRDVFWKDLLGISEAMWLLECDELGPLLVDGDSEGNSYVAEHADEVNAPLLEIYKELPEPILKRFGEVTDPTQELIR